MDGVFVLQDVLLPDALAQLHQKLDLASFAGGNLTARGMAQSVKNNLQLTRKEAPELVQSLCDTLLGVRALHAVAMPKALVRVMVNAYLPGMSYGRHTDAAVIDGHRSDISFTLFLSDPASYEGGELCLASGDGERKVKLAAGSLVLYPTGVLHRVAPVISGTRMAVVGWIQSRVRDAHKRQVLLELDAVRRAYLNKVGHDAEADLLLKNTTTLRRWWDA